MARSQNSFMKAQRAKEKQRKKKEKAEKMLQRKENNSKGGSLDDMIVYVDENGILSSTPPEV